jgi:hypothetical protein
MHALRAVGVVSALAIFVGACLVSVDESKLDAKSADAGGDVATSDASSDATADAITAIDAAPYVGMSCGTSFCKPPGEVCCATTDGDPDISHGQCSTSDLCQTGDYFGCESELDCAESGYGSALCCIVHDGDAFNITKCAATCASGNSQLCDPAGNACPVGRECLASPEFPALYECLVPP